MIRSTRDMIASIIGMNASIWPSANIAHRQSQDEDGEQQADDGDAEPDLLPARRRIEQPQVVLRHESPLKADMRRSGSKQVSLSGQASATSP